MAPSSTARSPVGASRRGRANSGVWIGTPGGAAWIIGWIDGTT